VDTPFLSALDDPARRALIGLGRQRHFDAGSPVFLEGDVGANVMVIRSGHVKVYATSADGHERLLAIAGPGDALGELSAIDGKPRSASGTALNPVDVYVVAADDFRAYLANTPGVALAVLQQVITRVRNSDRHRVEFGALDATGRVAARLVELADTTGEPTDEGIRLTLPLTQDDLANWISASREAVARALGSLRKRGLITTGRREITIIDLPALRDATH
jgi:CRP-like cAMP-binding protein